MGWKQHCPRCNQVRETTCSACGCGNCLTCGYRFCCIAIDRVLGEVIWLPNTITRISQEVNPFNYRQLFNEPEYYI